MNLFSRVSVAMVLVSLLVPLPTEAASTAEAMRKAFDSLANIQLVLSADDSLKVKDVQLYLRQDFAHLSALKHSVPKEILEKDPAAAIALQTFMSQISVARLELLNGNIEEARALVQGASVSCFACHSSMPAVNYEDVKRRVRKFTGDDWRKADFYASTRQTEEALKLYRELFDVKGKVSADPFRRARALKRMLTLLVRVNGDPKRAVAELEWLTGATNLDRNERALVVGWLEDAKYWRDKDAIVPADLSPTGLMKAAQQLYDRSVSMSRSAEGRSGEVSALRATALMHEALRRGLSGDERGEGLLLLGLSYRQVSDPGFARLDGAFLEACIRENAGKPVAEKCYSEYFRDISRSLSAPAGRRAVGEELRKLAEPKAKP